MLEWMEYKNYPTENWFMLRCLTSVIEQKMMFFNTFKESQGSKFPESRAASGISA